MAQTIAEALAEMDREKNGTPPPRPTAEQCAAIAKEYHLGLGDAANLYKLASTVDEARKIAAGFQPPETRQLARADLKTMSPEDIVAAQEAGRLDDLTHATGASAPPEEKPPAGQLSRSEMAKMTPDEITQARADGELDHVLGIKPT